MSATELIDAVPGEDRDPVHGFSRVSTFRLAERIQEQREAAKKFAAMQKAANEQLAAMQQAANQQLAAAQAEVLRLGGACDELVAMWLPEGSTFEQAWKDDHDGLRSLVEGKQKEG